MLHASSVARHFMPTGKLKGLKGSFDESQVMNCGSIGPASFGGQTGDVADGGAGRVDSGSFSCELLEEVEMLSVE